MRRSWIAIGTFAGLALLSALVFSYSKGPSPREFQVRKGNIHLVVVARGKVEPYAEIPVGAKTTERIEAVLVKEGDLVKRGQIIALLDDGELLAQLEQAKAHVEEAKARLKEVEAGPREQELEASRAKNTFSRLISSGS